ncbi:carbohydrate kinase [Aliishimia ponticola]|uniref:Carbohydrate kinase n=1 Tax=Aliishimia ponticola TaxID=2499833 RepID=A0A4S4NA69_9RHOB|nr:carbohydrate kinase [Aliishimia ponticola]THH36099.1 carbohydrate kinase [Aliishimia ponticola]
MILCVGEALIDMIPDRQGTPQPHVGGAVLNTARALGRLDQDVALLTGLSSDEYGRLIEEAMIESGVTTTQAVRSDRPTTLAIVELNDGQARYEFRDEGSALRDLTFADLPAPTPGTQALFFGGISLCNPPVADAFAEYATRHAASYLTFLDPNLRPGFANDPAGYFDRLHRMMQVSDIVKMSDDDLGLLHPDVSLEDAVAKVLAAGPKLLLLTLGGDGARAIHVNGTTARVPGQKVDVVDTVGAGDTFNAGVLARAAQLDLLDKSGIDGWTPEQMRSLIDLGARAAAVTVSRAGANPPRTHELPV